MVREGAMSRSLEGIKQLAFDWWELYLPDSAAQYILECFQVIDIDGRGWGCLCYDTDVSTGIYTFIKGCIQHLNITFPGYSTKDEKEADEFVILIRNNKYAEISPCARSRMFRTPEIVYPIDWQAYAVAGFKNHGF